MKSKFAKITDRTLGAVLMFTAVTAVFRYYVPLSVAVFCGLSVTSGVYLISGAVAKRRDGKSSLSSRARKMFYDFMFLADNAPAKLLCDGLMRKGVQAAVRGSAVYTGSAAAFFCFDAPLDIKTSARIAARAKKHGKTRAVIFCKEIAAVVDADFEIKTVCGDEVYILFASLGALPKSGFNRRPKKRFAALRGALDGARIMRYIALSASLFAAYVITGYKTVPLVCAVISASLAATAAVCTLVKRARKKPA